MDKINAANDTFVAARNAYDADSSKANAAKWEAAEEALTVAKRERAADLRSAPNTPVSWAGEAERAQAERIANDAARDARRADAHRQAMSDTNRWAEFDASTKAVNDAMNTEPSDI